MPTIVYLQEHQATTMASSFSTAAVGGGCAETLVTDVIGGRLFSMPSAAGEETVQHSATRIRNDHETSSVNALAVYLQNALEANTTADVLSAISSSSSDDSTLFLRVVGNSATTGPEYIPLNGTTSVGGLRTWFAGGVYAVELREMLGVTPVESDPFALASGQITLSCGTQTLGVIPQGRKSASSLVDIGLDLSANTSETIATAATAPSGITFSRPRTQAAALHLYHTLAPADYATLWHRVTLPAGCPPLSDMESVLDITFQIL